MFITEEIPKEISKRSATIIKQFQLFQRPKSSFAFGEEAKDIIKDIELNKKIENLEIY